MKAKFRMVYLEHFLLSNQYLLILEIPEFPVEENKVHPQLNLFLFRKKPIKISTRLERRKVRRRELLSTPLPNTNSYLSTYEEKNNY